MWRATLRRRIIAGRLTVREEGGSTSLRLLHLQAHAVRPRLLLRQPGDAPIVGDFNGDGKDTVSIYRASEQRFYIVNHLGDGAAGLGAADYLFAFGNPRWHFHDHGNVTIPVTGKFNTSSGG